MPGKSVEKTLVHAQGKVDGKLRQWIVGCFASEKMANDFVAILRMAYTHTIKDTITKMDVHAPKGEKGELPTEVKFQKGTIQYNPSAPAFDEEIPAPQAASK